MGLCAAKEKGASGGTNSPEEQIMSYKVLIIGAANAGKTSMLNRFVNHSFPVESEATLCNGPVSKIVQLPDGTSIELLLIDTAGQEKFRTITSSHYRGCHGVVLVFDLNDESSAASLPNWLNEIERYSDGVSEILVGNKKDLPEAGRVKMPDAAGLRDLKYFECSALTGEGIDEVFMGIVKQLQEDAEVG